MKGSPNSTFINLMPKKDYPKSFSDYRAIDLCNLVCKMATKIIVERLKPKISESIWKEQFVFLTNRRILDSIGTTHECIHTIKRKHMSYAIMKLSWAKAYGKVNWDFLSLSLLHIGLPQQVMRWIMSCVSCANFFSFNKWVSYLIFQKLKRVVASLLYYSYLWLNDSTDWYSNLIMKVWFQV